MDWLREKVPLFFFFFSLSVSLRCRSCVPPVSLIKKTCFWNGHLRDTQAAVSFPFRCGTRVRHRHLAHFGVSVLHSWYVKKPSWQNNKCMEKIIQIVCHRKWLKPWGGNLGQYSLLESYNYNPSRLLYNRCITSFVNKPRNGQTESNRIKLPLEVKKAIIVSLKSTNG
jgi:hypothetical protein